MAEKKKKKVNHLTDISYFEKEVGILKEKEKTSQIIDIGEKYELMTGIPEENAGGLDARLLPNLHKRWIPSTLNPGLYNKQLYKDYAEQEFYEGFIQPLFVIYKTGVWTKHFAGSENILTYNWEKHIHINALGPEKALFEKKDETSRSLTVGEIETTLILVTHFIDDLYKYSYPKIARRFGASVAWVKDFRRRIQKTYGKLAATTIEEHLERQLMRCEGLLDTFLEKARDGDPIAAKVVKDFMDKEDSYIMPTLGQLTDKETEKERDETIKRLEDIFDKRKKVEFKDEK